MFNFLIFIMFCVAATIHIFVRRKQLKKGEGIDLALLYVLVGGVGVIGAVGFIAHLFFANQVAHMIGWPAGNPFQFEVGCHDGAWALLGFLCLYFRKEFWLATGFGWSFFMLGAAYGHIQQTVIQGDYAPYNFGSILPDLLVPIVILTLLFIKMRRS